MPILYVESTQPRAGKTALASSLARILVDEGMRVSLLKPLALSLHGAPDVKDEDTLFFRTIFKGYPDDPTEEWPVLLEEAQWQALASAGSELRGRIRDKALALARSRDAVLVEGVGRADASSGALADSLDARVIVVAPYSYGLQAEPLVSLRQTFGDRLAGIIINGVTRYQAEAVASGLAPALEAGGLKVLGAIPEDRRLLGFTLEELRQRLNGEFVFFPEKGSELASNVVVGAMAVDSGVTYFGLVSDKVAVIRGNRPDLQMACLETPTKALVCTGDHRPIQYVEHTVKEKKVPVVIVKQDTLSTLAALEGLQASARFHHPAKLERYVELLRQHADLDALRRAATG